METQNRGQTCGHSGWRKDWNLYITICKIDSQWEFAAWHRELKSRAPWQTSQVGWSGRWGGHSRGREYIYLWLVHVDEWQKLTQYCKAIILQLKKRERILNCELDYWNNSFLLIRIFGSIRSDPEIVSLHG